MTGVILILKDVTEQRRLEEMKSGLVSTVSHQLKTPLTSIRMAIHLLLEEKVGPLTEKQAEAPAGRPGGERPVCTASSRISWISAGWNPAGCGWTFRRSPPQTLVTEAVAPFRRAAQDGGVELETRLPDDLPPVCADAGQIGHVFSNLLSNALRYTAPGGRITVSAAAEERDGPFSRVRYGQRHSPSIPSRRSSNSSSGCRIRNRRRAPGLGLAIAKEIVEAHGGEINVESREGAGTTFTFTLKRADRSTAGG